MSLRKWYLNVKFTSRNQLSFLFSSLFLVEVDEVNLFSVVSQIESPLIQHSISTDGPLLNYLPTWWLFS